MCDAVDKLQFLSFICNVTDNIFPLTGLFSETPVPLLSPKVEVLELPLVLLTLATYSTASHCFHIHVRALHNTNRKSWLANDSSDAVVHGCTCPCAMCQFTSPDADAMELYWAVWIGYKLRHMVFKSVLLVCWYQWRCACGNTRTLYKSNVRRRSKWKEGVQQSSAQYLDCCCRGSKGGGTLPTRKRFAPSAPQLKFLVSMNRLVWTFSGYVLVLCQ